MYDWNEPPEAQLVHFRDFVGVNIAPVSKKTAVKYIHISEFYPQSLREKTMFIECPQITTV